MQLFKITVSFGGCGSVVEMPCALSHASIPSDELVLPLDLVRMSVGIEDINDILADIEQVCVCARVRAHVCVRIVICNDILDCIERVRTCVRARMHSFVCVRVHCERMRVRVCQRDIGGLRLTYDQF